MTAIVPYFVGIKIFSDCRHDYLLGVWSVKKVTDLRNELKLQSTLTYTPDSGLVNVLRFLLHSVFSNFLRI